MGFSHGEARPFYHIGHRAHGTYMEYPMRNSVGCPMGYPMGEMLS